MEEKVSVVIPFYGKAQVRHLNLAVNSILAQKNVDVDLVLAGINISTRINSLEDISKHPNEQVPEIIRTGAVINNGLRSAEGEFVYVTDADILLAHSDYLRKLIEYSKNGRVALKRPPMRRLMLEDFDWFYSMVNSKGLDYSIGQFDFSEDYIVKPNGAFRPMRIFPKFENGREKVFIASEKDFQEYVSNDRNEGYEPRYFNQDRHCGGVFATSGSFRNIGGYHEGFISWGVWDADVQWKLENETGMELIPNTQNYSVIHLDHEKGYFSKSKWAHDKELQFKRRKKGFQECFEEDVKNFAGGYNEK